MAFLCSLALVLIATNLPTAAEVVSFASGKITLHGVMYRPAGAGPFRAVLYNHGSALDNSEVSDALGPKFAAAGWIFFMPHRRGQGLSASAGPYIREEIKSAGSGGDISAAASTMTRLLKTDHLDDQLAALDWLRKRDDVQPDRIAAIGNSFGGIETILGAEYGTYCAAVDLSGGAESWAKAPELQALMLDAVARTRAPLFFIQPENDFDLAPTRALSAAAKAAGKPFEVKIFPPFGNSAEQGHSFAYRGAALWADDALRFIERNCGKR